MLGQMATLFIGLRPKYHTRNRTGQKESYFKLFSFKIVQKFSSDWLSTCQTSGDSYCYCRNIAKSSWGYKLDLCLLLVYKPEIVFYLYMITVGDTYPPKRYITFKNWDNASQKNLKNTLDYKNKLRVKSKLLFINEGH